MKHLLRALVVTFVIPLCIASCGDDDRRPGDSTDVMVDGGGVGSDGGGGDSDGGMAPTGDLIDHPRSSSGTTELSYNFLDTVTFETYRPPSPYSETATVTPNADLTQLTVELGVCSGTGDYVDTNEAGEHRYEMDLDSANCAIMVNGEVVDMTYSGGRIFWGPDGIRTFFSGDGAITNSTSIVLVEHN